MLGLERALENDRRGMRFVGVSCVSAATDLYEENHFAFSKRKLCSGEIF